MRNVKNRICTDMEMLGLIDDDLAWSYWWRA